MIIPKSKFLLCSSTLLVSLCVSVGSKSINVNADSSNIERVAAVESNVNINPSYEEFKDTDIEKEVVKSEVNLVSLGEFKITVYDACENCSGEWSTMLARPCSDGHSAIPNHTVAVDPSVIPYGTVLLIDRITYVAEDCGGAVKGNVIDVYVEDCRNSFGSKYSEVFKLE